MRKPVSARVNGVLDYAAVAAFLNAPMVFGFHGTPAAVAYWVAGIHLLMTGCTDFPVGFALRLGELLFQLSDTFLGVLRLHLRMFPYPYPHPRQLVITGIA